MDMNDRISRRELLRGVFAGAFVSSIAGIIELARTVDSEVYAAEAVKLIDEQKDYSARALGFFHDGSKTKRTDAKERCGTCKQFKKVAVVDGVEVGKCSLLAKGLVKQTGWCRSYLKDETLYKKA